MPEQLPASTDVLLRGAQYVRMSTDHQQYSTENQTAAMELFAATRGIQIVRSFVDSGKSGLHIAGRDALKELIQVVESGQADFQYILVYDVSRWGRFQDADESAYYEYICKRAGIRVLYCAEPFENDDSTQSNLIKALKRTMAGEYSRELSVKVFAGQCRLIEQGFRQGGPAGYGLRRQLIDRNGNPKGILNRGQCKSIQTDRVVLVPGPEEEVRIVREIYDLFTLGARTEREIAELLNSKGILTDLGRPWTRGTVHQLLINPKYIGSNIYNRKSFKLKKKRVSNPPEMWLCRNNSFAAVVMPEQFTRAQEIIQARHVHHTDEQMLDLLKKLLARTGALSGILIDEMEEMPSSSMYRTRFKSLLRVYKLIGYTPERDYTYLEINREIRKFHKNHCQEIINDIREMGASVDQDQATDLLLINREFTASVIIAPCRRTPSGDYRWLFRLEQSFCPDITIAGRLNPGNQSILDYYLLPSLDIAEDQIRLAPDNGIALDVYRFADLSFFIGLARRRSIAEVA
jgi:DNA invertase Pin-like site-specific DNA recombinase